MNSLLRIQTTISLNRPDRPPILGGWLAAPEHIQSLTGCSCSDYWDEPFYWGAEAEKVLGSDGVVDIFVPVSKGEYRVIDHDYPSQQHATSVDAFLTWIDAQPGEDVLVEQFDPEELYHDFRKTILNARAALQDVVWIASDWQIIPNALGHWSYHFGIETTMMTMALHPERFQKLIQNGAISGRQKAELFVRAVREGLIPPVILTGEDLCSQQGPMVSPAFLRKNYWPWVDYALEPLREAGIKVVWHCDGNWQKIITDVIACGVDGLQGFQEECGMRLDWISSLRTRTGDPLVIFGPISVTGALLHGNPHDVKIEVHKAMEICKDNAGLFFFTSNTITPDIPIDNLITLWDTVKNSSWQ